MSRFLSSLVIVLAVAGIGTVLMASSVSADFSYQGRLTDDQDDPVSGSYNITVSLYNVPTSGAALWSETHVNVPVTDGLFNIEVGSVNSIPTLIWTNNSTLYLGVILGGSGELLPRTKLLAVPFANTVGTVDEATGGKIVTPLEIETVGLSVPLTIDGGDDVNGDSGGALFIDGIENLRIDGNEIASFANLGSRLLLQAEPGNVGVGESVPKAKLHITGDDGDLGLQSTALQSETVVVEDDDAILGLYSSNLGVAGSGIAFGEINSSAALTSKWAILRETGSFGGLRFTSGASSNPYANDAVVYLERGGSVGIGTTSPNQKLDVRGSIGNNTTVYHSDRRWKRNIRTIEAALDYISRLRGVRYEWRKDEYAQMNFPEGERIGLIAQEVEEVLPELVHTGNDGYKSVEYANLVAVLIEAVKELREENRAQSEQLERLTERIEQLHQLQARR